MTFSPANLVANRNARLVTEARTPVYTTSTPTPEEARAILIKDAQDRACTEDFCFICSRATDHWGEHSDAQILAWATGHPSRL